MALRNTLSSYGSVSKSLHWIVFILVTAMFIIGFIMGDVDKSIKGIVYNIHKLTGLCVLIFMVTFAFWSLINPKPLYPAEMHKWEKKLAHIVHMLIYLLLIAMPITGLIMSTAAGKNPHIFGFEIIMPGIEKSKPLGGLFADIHEILAWAILAILALHIIGALKHHIIDKNNILKRMMGCECKEKTS